MGAKEEAIYEAQNDNPIYRKKIKDDKHQLLPIYLRITIKGKRFEVASHRHVKPSDESPSAGKVKGRSEISIENKYGLDEIKKGLCIQGNDLD